MVAIRKHPRRIANTYQPAQKDPRVPKRVPKINRKIANPQNEPWARLGFPAAQKIKPACKSERKNYKSPKEAMTPKVLTFAPHAEMVILIYIIIKERSGLPDEQETFTQVTSTVS